jgi:hypothetical protein
MGININDSTQDFTGQILRGEKTIETRSTRSLDPYIGNRVGIIRTGVGKATLVGYATVGEPVFYDSVAKFRRDQSKHLVAPGSAFDIKDRLRYGYPLMQVEAVEPKEIESRGIVARKINPMTKQTNTPEFKRWFGDSKVVDSNGEPMVVYHGTSKDKPFSSFTRNAQGTWFTSDPEAASSYATTNDSQKVVYEDGRYVSKNTSAQVFPVYLSIKNPLKVEGEVLKKWQASVNYRAANKMLVGDAKYRGYDGLMFGEGVFVAFEPTQIKSAIGNKGTFDPKDSNITNPYTKPDLRERLKRKIIAGNKGGGWGQWSARKAQLLAAEYEKAGGGYTGKRTSSQKSLSKWSQQDWRTKSGKPSSQTGERYLPAKAIEGLTVAEYAATTRAKRKATGQYSRQPKRIAMKTKEFRNPMDPRSMVDDAARAAGYTTKAFHRTSSKFTKFIPGGPNATREIWKTKSGESRTLFGQSGRAMWFGTSPDNLPAYHNEPTGKGVVLMVYLKNPSPLQVDDDTRDWARDLYGDGSKNFPLLLSDEHIKSIRDDGYTGIEYWQSGKTADKSDPDEIVVFDANQIKSADLVTYDDADNAIPISNRFNGKSDDIRNPVTPSIRKKLESVIEKDDRILCYDTATDEDFYRLWDIIHTDLMLNKESLREIEGMLDDDGVLVIESGETPAGLQDHFRKATRYQGLLLVQGPLNPEQARIETEKLRRDLE